MKQSVKFVILAAVIVTIFTCALLGYKYLSGNYQPEDTDDKSSSSQVAGSAPDFSVIDKDGKTVKLSDYFGKPIVLNFWATWCGPCKTEMPAFDEVYKEYGEEVVFLMVNLTDGYRDTVDGAKKFIADSGYSFPIYFDTAYSGSKAYNVYSIPLTVLIDENGAIYKKHTGIMNQSVLTGYIKNLIGG